MKKIFTTAIIALLTTSAFCQSPLRKGVDECFDKQIKTLQLRKFNSEMTDPVILLGSNEQLQLSFDDMSSEIRYFTYKIALCDADWNESNLFYADYIEGFPEDYISSYERSFNSLVAYTNFSLTIPNQQMQLKLSGNYLLKVYDSNNLQELLFQKSFSVAEPSPVGVRAYVRTRQLAGSQPCSQQLEFSVQHPSLTIHPYTEIKVRVEQNGYRFTQLPNPAPTFIRSNVIEFSEYNKNQYPGGSEYRSFDISSLEYKTLRVRNIEVVDRTFHVRLEEDAPFKQYIFSNDMNGRYLIRNQLYRDESSYRSEYPYVYLSLYMPQPLMGKVYIFGELSNWELSNDFVMLYNTRRQAYEITLPLKQGYYNYKYVYVDESGKVDMGRIDGCSSEAENTYGIHVYYRGSTDRHDRLMNVTYVSSMENIEKKK
jgi:hypothetical protein